MLFRSFHSDRYQEVIGDVLREISGNGHGPEAEAESESETESPE